MTFTLKDKPYKDDENNDHTLYGLNDNIIDYGIKYSLGPEGAYINTAIIEDIEVPDNTIAVTDKLFQIELTDYRDLEITESDSIFCQFMIDLFHASKNNQISKDLIFLLINKCFYPYDHEYVCTSLTHHDSQESPIKFDIDVVGSDDIKFYYNSLFDGNIALNYNNDNGDVYLLNIIKIDRLITGINSIDPTIFTGQLLALTNQLKSLLDIGKIFITLPLITRLFHGEIVNYNVIYKIYNDTSVQPRYEAGNKKTDKKHIHIEFSSTKFLYDSAVKTLRGVNNTDFSQIWSTASHDCLFSPIGELFTTLYPYK